MTAPKVDPMAGLVGVDRLLLNFAADCLQATCQPVGIKVAEDLRAALDAPEPVREARPTIRATAGMEGARRVKMERGEPQGSDRPLSDGELADAYEREKDYDGLIPPLTCDPVAHPAGLSEPDADMHASTCAKLVTPGKVEPSRRSEFLNWVADRLVHVYGESPNVDFVLALKRYASEADPTPPVAQTAGGGHCGCLNLFIDADAAPMAKCLGIEVKRG